MKSVLRMSDQELLQEESPGLSLNTAAVLSVACTGLSLAGMMLRFHPDDPAPISGINTFEGQLTIATGLGASMFAAAWLIRGIIMQRLQWAVVCSLVIHLMVCLTMHSVVVDVPVAMAAEFSEDVPLEELTLPDYGGIESISSPEQAWERPADVELQQNEQQQLERQEAEPEMNAEPQDVELQREIQQAQVPQRQQQQQQMEDAQQLELERQQREAESNQPEQVEAPQVVTREVEQPNLESQNIQRLQADLQNERREQQQLESNVSPQLQAMAAARAESRMEEIQRMEIEQRRRETSRARAETVFADSVEVSEAAAASQAAAEAQQMETARQSNADLPSNRRLADSPESSSEMQLQRFAPSRSESANNLAESSAPASGGAASMNRAAASGGASSGAAGGTSAQAVNVASAGGANSANLAAATNASNVARGNASMPAPSAGGGGLPSFDSSSSGVPVTRSQVVGRGSGSARGANLGSSLAGGQSTMGRQSNNRTGSSAAGSNAGSVNVAAATGSGGSTQQVLSGGPTSSASNVGRSGGSLPSRNPGSGTGAPASSGSGFNVAMASRSSLSGSGRGRASGRGTDARLGSTIGGGTADLSSGTGRRTVAGLPAGAIAAEAAGDLVFAGPQGTTSGGSGSSRISGGTLNGPRSTTVGRRSAGLPGLSRGPASMSGRPSSLPGGLAGSRLPSRARSSAAPKIGSSTDIASLIRRSVPGISAISSERISAGFSMRTPESRAEAVRQLGGNDVSEAAVERGLEWLAAHQFAAGNWSHHNMNCRDHDCGQAGDYNSDPAATGLALLAFLGAGNTHQTGDYQQEVQRALNWLIERQKDDGDLFHSDQEFAWFYSHGIAAIALCEAYGMTKDGRLREPAQKALNFIAASQHKKFGGWRYIPQLESDTSVSGWQLMALKSGQMAGLKIQESTLNGVRKWLDSVESSPGRFRYHPAMEVTDSMSAEGLLMRQYLGAARTNDNLVAGAHSLLVRLPEMSNGKRDAYYWYYATQVMFHMQGEFWEKWNASLRDMLVDAQEKTGPTRGSWAPKDPTVDKWGYRGGRHYVTCLHLLMLEVYYRHLPLYIDLD